MLTFSNFIFASTYSVGGENDKTVSTKKVKKVEKMNTSRDSDGFLTVIPGKYYGSFPQPGGSTVVVCLGEKGICINTVVLNPDPDKVENSRVKVFLNGKEQSSFTADAKYESNGGHYIFHNVKY